MANGHAYIVLESRVLVVLEPVFHSVRYDMAKLTEAHFDTTCKQRLGNTEHGAKITAEGLKATHALQPSDGRPWSVQLDWDDACQRT